MPEKSKAPKKKTSRAAAPARRAKGKTQKRPPDYFVVTQPLNVTLLKAEPDGASRGAGFVTFAEARRAAIDALVDVIEQAESQLDALKRAGSFEDLMS